MDKKPFWEIFEGEPVEIIAAPFQFKSAYDALCAKVSEMIEAHHGHKIAHLTSFEEIEITTDIDGITVKAFIKSTAVDC